LETLYQQYDSKGVIFIAVALPWSSSHPEYQNVSITEFLSKYNSSLTYVYDSAYTASSMYDVKFVPTLFVLSKGGPVYGTYGGEDGVEDTEILMSSVAKDIDKALSEPEPA